MLKVFNKELQRKNYDIKKNSTLLIVLHIFLMYLKTNNAYMVTLQFLYDSKMVSHPDPPNLRTAIGWALTIL